jgi:predicted alpha/beta superfamily hydrolase
MIEIKSKFIKLFLLVLFSSTVEYSQYNISTDENSKSLTSIISFDYISISVGDTFVIDVSLPASYSTNDSIKYPVIYLTDGYWRRDQHKSIHALAQSDGVKELIVVAIGYPESYDFNKIRVRDLVQHADKFLDFVIYELIPIIDQKYRTTRERTLWGSSFGGYFAMFSLFNYANKTEGIFKNYIIASPPPNERTNLDGETLTLFDLEKMLNNQSDNLPVNVYLTVGAEEDVYRFIKPIKELIQIFQSRAYKNFRLEWLIDPGKDHFTVWEPTLYQGIRLFLKKST